MHCHVFAHSLFLICQCTLKDLHLLLYTHSQMQGLVYLIHHGHLSTEKNHQENAPDLAVE